MASALTDNGRTVIERRIAPRDKEGNPQETADQVFKRVAKNIALADKNYGADDSQVADIENRFYELMSSLDFLPNSPTLVNAGRELQQLSACFVLPVEDSMEGIFEAVKQAALIHKTGGGTGFSFSRLRPESSDVSSTSGIASGPVSFMQVFDKATEVIKQGGTRRGANMGILRVDHPDILKFIHMKDDNKTLQNFNISVAITNEFMEALNSGGEYALRSPNRGNSNTTESNQVATPGTLSAAEVWSAITEGAHKTGDPGVIFIDRINSGKANPVPTRGPIESTNPCGEQPLYPYDSCNLGSINLANFVKEGKVDYARLSDVVKDCVHFLDNVIDMNKWPNEQIKEVSMAIRRIGLGVMGWADMLLLLGIRYGSSESLAVADSVMGFIQKQADQASTLLGMKRGPFPDIENSIYKGTTMRNSTRTTIAPTGTISIIAGVSSGIEPVFAFEYTRSHYLDKDPNKRYEMKEVHPILYDFLEKEMDRLGVKEGEQVAIPIPEYFVSAHEIPAQQHIGMQAVFQTYTDNAVSKTINLPNEATVEDVDRAYKLAWLTGCNGVTVYRDGSKDMQVLSVNHEKKEEVVEDEPDTRERGTRRRVEQTREGLIHTAEVGGHKFYIQVGLFEDGNPGEVFIIGNKSGSTTRGYLDAIGSVISLALQYGAPIGDIADKLSGTRFEPNGFTQNDNIKIVTSPLDYIGRWLSSEFSGEPKAEGELKEASGELCPDCDGQLYAAAGCFECVSCGYSKCG